MAEREWEGGCQKFLARAGALCWRCIKVQALRGVSSWFRWLSQIDGHSTPSTHRHAVVFTQRFSFHSSLRCVCVPCTPIHTTTHWLEWQVALIYPHIDTIIKVIWLCLSILLLVLLIETSQVAIFGVWKCSGKVIFWVRERPMKVVLVF